MASSKLKKQIESIKNIGGDKEERKINNPFIEEGGDNNQIILKSFSNLSSSSLLSSSSQTLPFHSTTVVSSFNNNSSSVSVQTSSIANNNYLIPYCDNTSEFVNSSIILKDNSSSGETKSPLLPLRQKDTSGSGESNSSIKLNSSSSYTTKSSSSQISSSTQLDSSSLPEEFNSSISSNSSKTSSSIKSSAPNNSSTPQPSSSPSSTVTFVPRRRPRHISGIGGGRVRILGVHSEPGSFALEESPLEEEELLVFNKSEGENKIKLEEQQISSKQRSHNFKGRRQLSAMSSLYRQATIGAAAASVFNSTATTVANALEFVSNVEQQHPNVPPPPHNSRSESPTNNSSGSVSDNSWSPGGNRAMRKLKKEVKIKLLIKF
uniref:Uncharacterized protein n=1 Tax=Meloidogyne hapla TaxID=6305 RepID=A0A1I8BM05_MELHA